MNFKNMPPQEPALGIEQQSVDFTHATCTTAQQTITNLYIEHQRWLSAWLQRKLTCSYDAADLAQDTFVKLLGRQDIKTIREPRAYLATIARGLFINLYRRREIEKACLDALTHLPDSVAQSPDVQLELMETLVQIDLMLDGLPFKVKKAFLLTHIDGLNYKEIALQLKVSVSSVKKYMMRATHHCLLVKLQNK